MIREPRASAPPVCGPRLMRLTFLTGIWPPDVGGPATHGPEFSTVPRSGAGTRSSSSRWATASPTVRPCEVVVVSRASRSRFGTGRVAVVATRRARTADVVYATATYAAAQLRPPPCRGRLSWRSSSPTRPTSALAGTGSSTGRSRSSSDAGDRSDRGSEARHVRHALCAAPGRVVVPSRLPRRDRPAWGLDRSRITVLPNPAPDARCPPATRAPGRSSSWDDSRARRISRLRSTRSRVPERPADRDR